MPGIFIRTMRVVPAFSPLLVVMLLVLGPNGPAHAQERESPLRDVLHARGFGMAGAYRGSALGGEVINGNPAGIGAWKHFIAELGGSMDLETRQRMGNLALVDNTTGGLAGGYTYSLIRVGPDEDRRTAHQNTLALAGQLSDNLYLGVSGRHILERGSRRANAITMDTGLFALLGPVRLGVSGHNLINIHNPDLERYYAVGAALTASILTVSGDLRGDWERDIDGKLALAYSVGAEVMLIDMLPLRAGFSHDLLTGVKYWGGGLGLYGDGSGVDFGYRHEIGGLGGRTLALTLRFQMG